MEVLIDQPVSSRPQDSAANDELQRFVYIASHDLSAPARQLKAFLGMLEQDHSEHLNEDALELVRYAIGSADHMQLLLSDLLQYSRIETEAKAATEVNLTEVVKGALTATSQLAFSVNAKIASSELPVVAGCERQLTQLFAQLISNAIEHNHNPTPSVHVSASVSDDMHIISVLDNGEPIDVKHHEAVFELFHRLEGTHSQHSGAGLAIARRIARRHGGDLVWAEENITGNCLRLTLPMAPKTKLSLRGTARSDRTTR